jgi:hypothetical protein
MTVAPCLGIPSTTPNGFPGAADVNGEVESESLTGIPVPRAYELRPHGFDDPVAYSVVDQGDLQRVKRRIAKHLRGSGVLMLHDLAVPATSTTIDHLCIGPNGVTAIDVERGKPGTGRDTLVRRVSRETEILAAVLIEAGIGSEQITGAVCQPGRYAVSGSKVHGITFGNARRVAKVARGDRGGRPLDVQLALAVVRNRLGYEGQRSYPITRPYVV